MVPHVDTNTLLVELDQRRDQVALQRLASSCNRSQERRAGPVRWALGNALLRLGALVMGEERLLASNSASAG